MCQHPADQLAGGLCRMGMEQLVLTLGGVAARNGANHTGGFRMPYVEGQTIHDADSHVMELPGTINRYLAPQFRAAFAEKTGRGDESPHWSQQAQAQHEDPEFVAGAEANILLRKNYQALGAFRAEDRPKTLDYLGFASQL